MSNEAVHWAMDDAPMLRTDKGKPDTTARHVLQVLAEHASATGTNAHPSVLRIQYRTGYDRATVQRALRRLEGGALIAKDGTTEEGRTRYRLAMHMQRPEADWGDLEKQEEGFRAAAAERKRRSRAKGVTHAESVTVTDSEGVTVTHAESVTGDVTHAESGRHALKVRPSRTERGPNHQQPPDNQIDRDSSAPVTHAESVTAADETASATLDAFGAFWLVYPKKRAREEARKAWIAAVERGADPEHMVTSATAYARERAGEDPKFTKHPATWLNKGCYDDEPDPAPNGRASLRAIAGSRADIPTHDDYAQGRVQVNL